MVTTQTRHDAFKIDLCSICEAKHRRVRHEIQDDIRVYDTQHRSQNQMKDISTPKFEDVFISKFIYIHLFWIKKIHGWVDGWI